MEISAVDRLALKLSGITRVEGYKRRGAKGQTEHVSTYVRKDLDVADIGSGKTKKGVFTGLERAAETSVEPELPKGWREYNGTYSSRGVRLNIADDAEVSGQDRNKLMSDIRDVLTKLPILDEDIQVDVVKKIGGRGLAAAMITGGHRIRVPAALVKNPEMGGGSNPMSAMASGKQRFRFAHEVGHVIATERGHLVKGDVGKTRADNKFWRDHREDLSSYAKYSDAEEAYSEAFGQWLLSDLVDPAHPRATVNNAAAQAYADRYGWKKRPGR